MLRLTSRYHGAFLMLNVAALCSIVFTGCSSSTAKKGDLTPVSTFTPTPAVSVVPTPKPTATPTPTPTPTPIPKPFAVIAFGGSTDFTCNIGGNPCISTSVSNGMATFQYSGQMLLLPHDLNENRTSINLSLWTWTLTALDGIGNRYTFGTRKPLPSSSNTAINFDIGNVTITLNQQLCSTSSGGHGISFMMYMHGYNQQDNHGTDDNPNHLDNKGNPLNQFDANTLQC